MVCLPTFEQVCEYVYIRVGQLRDRSDEDFNLWYHVYGWLEQNYKQQVGSRS